MPTLREQIIEFLGERKVRNNIRALMKYLALLFAIVLTFSVLFHVVMAYEGRDQEHSLLTGLYWTLTTMSTLGYGDVTFLTDLGRVFTIVVVSSGIVLLLVVLPFTFIRYFYAPWLETQMRLQTPREVPKGTRDHIIICSYDPVAPGFVRRLATERIPYFIIEPDLERAAEFYQHGTPAVVGEVDEESTYESMNVADARMVLANSTDAVNINICLTVRHLAPDVPLVAVAHDDHAEEPLNRSGASHVLPLNRWLGEQLANRINAKHAESHVIGEYRDLKIAELPVHQTPLVGKTIRETHLRESTGISVIGVWKRGRLHPARPDTELTQSSVPVIIGTNEQLRELDYMLMIYDINPNPAIVIGGGSVGASAARALRRRDVPVVIIEREAALSSRLRGIANEVVQGDAVNPEVLREAGIKDSPSVIITTREDAENIYVTTQCRRLNKDLRIVSRITHERNIDAIHTAGADFVLGSASVGLEATISILKGKQLVLLGEGVELFSMPLPASLRGKTLAESAIGAQTGLAVVAVERNGTVSTNPAAMTTLEEGADLVVFGGPDQRREFEKIFGES